MKRGKIILILVLMSISISILVYSFAYTTTTHTGDDSSYLMVSEIIFGLNDSVESINLEQQTPTIDKFGVLNKSFSFSITNTSNNDLPYTVRLIDKDVISTIPNEEIRYQLTVNGNIQEIQNLSNGGALDSGSIAKGDTIEYSLIVWLDYDTEITGGTWEKVASVSAGVANLDKSGANPPALLDNMIPVYYDAKEDVWRKADSTNSNNNHKWYDYDDRMWANAVTINSTSETNYFLLENGEVVLMDDISSFYVWIPRFKYDLFESGSPKIVNVTFEKGIENTGTMKCKIVDGTEVCTGETTSYTHPAFTFGEEELTGYWINKFELSPEPNTTCYSSVTSTNCNVNNLNLVSKPNLKSLINISIGNLFYSIRNMELNNNIYGFKDGGTTLKGDGSIDDDNNNYDIHLARNFESAALSYLTYSNYGKYSNPVFKSERHKYVLPNVGNFKTGSSHDFDKSYEYNVEYYGTGASTTGNIYGVYDLNGLINEHVMANVIDSNKNFYQYDSTQSQFTDAPLSKYYDIYKNTYGSGIGEFAGFSSDSSYLPPTTSPFIRRKSVETITYGRGSGNSEIGGRAVITVNDIYITKW